MSLVENDPARRRAAIDEIYTEDAFSTTPARESIVAVTKSTASRARSKLLTLNSDISQLPSPWNRAMAGWSAGYQAARVQAPAYAGTDFIIARDGRIAAAYLFFDKLP